MSVLYGVFLYMGIAALAGNQFYERTLMIFMQPAKYPKTPYAQKLPKSEVFKFTGIQIAVFAVLYIVKTIKASAIAFPLIIAACIPLRLWVLPKIFDADALLYLDGDDDDIREAEAKKIDDHHESATTSKATVEVGSSLDVAAVPVEISPNNVESTLKREQ
jgi:HCO3- transporter family.